MSLSPSAANSGQPSKRRKLSSGEMLSPDDGGMMVPPPQSTPNAPKRGARACTACRKGKNRCEGEAPCRRCQLSGTPCVFEKPERKKDQALNGPSTERLSRLEGQYLVMQSQMMGMQASLDRILSAVQGQPLPGGPPPQGLYGLPGANRGPPFPHMGVGDPNRPPQFPPLPGFAPPFAPYGIVPSTAASSEDESDSLPRASMSAPIEALQGLANAAAEAAAVPSESPPRVKSRKKAEPIPRNAFPHVVEKGLVSDSEARELYHIFFAGCHLFIPLFDPTYDTYESLMERTPWTFDAILAIAAKIRSGNGPLSPTFYKCLEEAQGIARSSLFGPVARKEAVQGMLLLAAWSSNGWLPSGHAMRMALDLGLDRALEQLADDSKQRTQEEERDLVVSSRIWLCLFWFDHQMSLGTGRPILLRDEKSIKHARFLLKHPMASATDVRLIAQVELMTQKTQIYETLNHINGPLSANDMEFLKRAHDALVKCWEESDELHRRTMDEDSLLRKILAGDLHYAKLWLLCFALRGVAWDKMTFEQRELAFQAKDAASNCLAIFLNSSAYRAALRYAVHDSLVTAAFSGLFLLKMAALFPSEQDLGSTTAQVEQLALLLSEVSAERYALTLRIMLANLRRKLGMETGAGTMAAIAPSSFAQGMMIPAAFVGPGTIPRPFTMDELGFDMPSSAGVLSPAAIPVWLQEQSLADFGLPVNGFEGVFLRVSANGWTGDLPPIPEAW